MSRDTTPFGETREGTPFETSLREMTVKRKTGKVASIAEQLSNSATGEVRVFETGTADAPVNGGRPATVYETGRDLGKRFRELEPEPRAPIRSLGPLDPRAHADISGVTPEEFRVWAERELRAGKPVEVVVNTATVIAGQQHMKQQQRRIRELVPEWGLDPERMAREVNLIKDFAQRVHGVTPTEMDKFSAFGDAETLAIWRDRWMAYGRATARAEMVRVGKRGNNLEQAGEYLASSNVLPDDAVEYRKPEHDEDFEARLAEMRKFSRTDSKDAIRAAGDLFATRYNLGIPDDELRDSETRHGDDWGPGEEE